ncbi:hypothetical protein [Streptomyces cyanogenus]|uniref:Uncharacterized protein n=1 Tax=Streptomyces cyanogenus TaxID=80860 RepID=A0ABX7TMJ0_STRCY|nr:hypothetical protein [Streptomyces cyanogenus]QTD96828.1 hypothetical protein S1361_05660 [Streptomyces cyanogenus]
MPVPVLDAGARGARALSEPGCPVTGSAPRSGLAIDLLSRARDDLGCPAGQFVSLLRRLLSRTSRDRALAVVIANLCRPASVAGGDLQDDLAPAVDDVLSRWP